MRIDNTDRYRMKPGETRLLTNAQIPSEWKQSNESKRRMKEAVQLRGKHVFNSLQHLTTSRK